MAKRLTEERIEKMAVESPARLWQSGHQGAARATK